MRTPAAFSFARLRAWIPNAVCASGRLVAAACSFCSSPAGMLSFNQLEIGRHAAIGKVRHEHHVRMLFDQPHELIVDVLVACGDVREGVEVGAQRALRVLERKDVRGRAQLVLVRFVDHRAVQIRRQLLELAHPVVDPDLDDVDFLGGEFLHGFAGFGAAW